MLTRLFQKLRFPYLFALAVVLFGVDLVIPDPIPFIDEALLAVLTVMLGVLRSRKSREETVDQLDD